MSETGWYLAELDDEGNPCRRVTGGPWENFDDIVWPDSEDGNPRYMPILIDPELWEMIKEDDDD